MLLLFFVVGYPFYNIMLATAYADHQDKRPRQFKARHFMTENDLPSLPFMFISCSFWGRRCVCLSLAKSSRFLDATEKR